MYLGSNGLEVCTLKSASPMGGMRIRQFCTEGEPHGGAGPVCTVHSMQVVGPATTTERQYLENRGVVTGSKRNKIKERLTVRNYRKPLVQNRKTHTLGWKVWESISPTHGATPRRGSPHRKLKGPRKSVGVHYPNSRGHTEVWKSITPTQGDTPKRGSPYPQIKGPHRSVEIHHPNSKGHTEAWESITPTQGATPKRESPYPQRKGSH